MREMATDPVIMKAPMLNGRMTNRELLAPAFNVVFAADLTDKDGLLFGFDCEGYSLRVFVEDGEFCLSRNGARASVAILDVTRPSVIDVRWDPESLNLVLTDRFGVRRDRVETAFTILPNEALDWLDAQEGTPLAAPHETPAQVLEAVLLALGSVRPVLERTGAWDAFWEADKSGKRVPKDEPKLTSILHGLFSWVARAHRIEVYPEQQTGTGRLDYLFASTLANGNRVEVCCEAKFMHSPRLAHGVEVQLPEYMRLRRTSLGVYVALDCGPGYPATARFNLPPQADGTTPGGEFAVFLASTKRGIESRVIPVAKPQSPSR